MWHAYVDESEVKEDSFHTYTLAAALIDGQDVDALRSSMLRLHRTPAPKLHWIRIDVQARELLVKTVAGFPALHVIVIRTSTPGEPGERARRKTFTRMFHELELRGVKEVTAEARQRKQNDRDIQLLRDLKAAKQIEPGTKIWHVPGKSEPLLWIPDIAAGAATAAVRGDERFLDLLDPVLDVIAIDDRHRI